jgi:hypothetical protein
MFVGRLVVCASESLFGDRERKAERPSLPKKRSFKTIKRYTEKVAKRFNDKTSLLFSVARWRSVQRIRFSNRRPGLESRQGVRFQGKHSNAFCKLA